MTSTTAAPSAADLARPAELRACGNAWEKVAADRGVPVAGVRKWPTLFPAVWKKTYSAAHKGVLRDALAEAVFTLRMQLREDDAKSQREAAAWLRRYWGAGYRHRVMPVGRATWKGTGTAKADVTARPWEEPDDWDARGPGPRSIATFLREVGDNDKDGYDFPGNGVRVDGLNDGGEQGRREPTGGRGRLTPSARLESGRCRGRGRCDGG